MTVPPLPAEGAAGLLLRAARSWPDQVYLRCLAPPFEQATVLTFDAVDRRSSEVAAGLATLGLERGSVVALCAQNSPEWIVLEWGLFKAGVILTTLNPHATSAEVSAALNQAGATRLFTDRPPHRLEVEVPISPLEFSVPGSGNQEAPLVEPDTPAMIQFTSGTTGFPKGVLLSHGALAANAIASQDRWSIGLGDRVAHGFPLFHIAGSGTLTLGPAAVGAETLPLPGFSARAAVRVLHSARCTHFFGTPTMLAALLAAAGEAEEFPDLRVVGVGGAPLPPTLATRAQGRLDVDLIDIFGQTETTGSFLTDGRPVAGVRATVVAESGEETAAGEPGELCYEGPGRMLGYVDGTATPVDAEGRLRTGDLATTSTDGRVTVVGRLRDVINRGGENLYPAEIEARLLAHPGIGEAVVIAVPDDHYGEVAWACAIPAPGNRPTEAEVLAWCAATLSKWKIPAGLSLLEDFPRTASGKVKKAALQESLFDRGSPGSRS